MNLVINYHQPDSILVKHKTYTIMIIYILHTYNHGQGR